MPVPRPHRSASATGVLALLLSVSPVLAPARAASPGAPGAAGRPAAVAAVPGTAAGGNGVGPAATAEAVRPVQDPGTATKPAAAPEPTVPEPTTDPASSPEPDPTATGTAPARTPRNTPTGAGPTTRTTPTGTSPTATRPGTRPTGRTPEPDPTVPATGPATGASRPGGPDGPAPGASCGPRCPLPEPRDDRVHVTSTAPVTFDPAANDSVRGPYRVVPDSRPRTGTVTVVGRLLRFTPGSPMTSCCDSFRYHLEPLRSSRPGPDRWPWWWYPLPGGRWPGATVHLTLDATTAVDDVAGPVTAGGTVTVDVLANDLGVVPGTTVRLAPARHGTATVAGGTIRYRPEADFAGVEVLTYRLCLPCDVCTVLGRARVRIEVVPPGPAVVARDDTAVAFAGDPVRIDVLANDEHASGLTLRLDGDQHGDVVLDGRVAVYTAAADSPATDGFGYRLLDPAGRVVARARVTVTVGAVRPDAVRTVPGQPVTIAVLDNDRVPPGYRPRVRTPPDHGTAAPEGDRIRYVPDAGPPVPDCFTYVLVGPAGHNSPPASVRVGPTGPLPDTAITAPGRAVDIDVLANDVGLGQIPVDRLRLEVTAPDRGTATVAGPTVRYRPPDGFTGTARFTYRLLEEPEGAGPPVPLGAATVTVTVTPPVARDDEATTYTGNAVRIDVTANDPDAAGFTVRPGPPGHGTVTPGGPGLVYLPGDGFAGTDRFGYELLDRTGREVAAATVTVTVLALLPVADTGYTSPGTVVPVAVTTNDTAPAGFLPAVVERPRSGTAVVEGTRIVYRPGGGLRDRDSFRYELVDAAGHRSAPATVTVYLVDARDDTGPRTTGRPVTVAVLANDVVAPGAHAEVTGTPAGGSVSPIRSTTGRFTFTPARGFTGTGGFRYAVVAAGRTIDTAGVTVAVVETGPTTRPDGTPAPTPSTTVDPTSTVGPGASATAGPGTTVPATAPTGNGTGTPGPTGNAPAPTTPAMTPATAGPDAVDDVASTVPGADIVIDVLTNDRGDLDPGSVRVVAAPDRGAVTVHPSGTVTYRPAPATTTGTDSFDYRVSGTSRGSDRATVTIGFDGTDALAVDGPLTPGSPLRARGDGCDPDARVRFWLDGRNASPARADEVGAFATTVTVPDRPGRFLLRADCPGHTFQRPVDLVVSTSAGAAAIGAVAAFGAVLVGGVFCFFLLNGLFFGPRGGNAPAGGNPGGPGTRSRGPVR